MQERKNLVNLLTAMVFFLSLMIFSGIFYFNIPTDLQDHVIGLILIIKHHSFPIPPLYYFLIYVFGGFTLNTNHLYIAASLLLSLSVAFKYRFSINSINNLHQSKKNIQLLFVAIFLLIFSSPVVYDYKQMFLGKISPNLWHNSTTIFLMPFAILLFDKSVDFLKLKQMDRKVAWTIVLIGVINLLIKPSFLFAFIPAFILMVLFENGIKSNMFKMALLIVTILSVFLLIEYYAIYKMNVIDAIRFKNDTKGIEVKPFHTFLMLNNGSWIKLILNFTTSLFLPIGCLIVFFKQIRNNNIAKFTYLIFLFSLLIGIMISEKGVMANNGNFIWQVYVSNYLLFLVMIKFAYEQIIAIGWRNKKSLIVMFIFAMHVISGFLYLAKIFYLRKYT